MPDMGKKKGSKQGTPVYVAPPKQKPEANVPEYDPATRPPADEFEQDLDFLLAAAPAINAPDDLEEKLGKLSLSSRPPVSQKQKNKPASQPVITKKLRREIMNFDIDLGFSDDDDDTEALTVPPLPKSSKKSKQQMSAPAPKIPPKQQTVTRQFESSHEYLKQQFGLSDTGSEADSNDSDYELEDNFKFQFEVSDEEEQIQLDEDYTPTRDEHVPFHGSDKRPQKAKQKKSKSKAKSGSAPNVSENQTSKKPGSKNKPQTGPEKAAGPKPLTRSSLLDNRPKGPEQPKSHNQKKKPDSSKSISQDPAPSQRHSKSSNASSSQISATPATSQKPKKPHRKRAPTARKEATPSA